MSRLQRTTLAPPSQTRRESSCRPFLSPPRCRCGCGHCRRPPSLWLQHRCGRGGGVAGGHATWTSLVQMPAAGCRSSSCQMVSLWCPPHWGRRTPSGKHRMALEAAVLFKEGMEEIHVNLNRDIRKKTKYTSKGKKRNRMRMIKSYAVHLMSLFWKEKNWKERKYTFCQSEAEIAHADIRRYIRVVRSSDRLGNGWKKLKGR